MKHNLTALFAIASAPVVDLDAPLPLRITKKGLATLKAHNAPVPTLRRCQRLTAPAVYIEAVEESETAPYDGACSEN